MRDPSAAAERLVGSPVTLTPLMGGGNNRVYRLDAEGVRRLLKEYPPPARDGRDRLDVEFRAVSFMSTAGLPVPHGIARDDEARVALYEWIDGEPVEEVTADDIDAQVSFLTRLDELRHATGAEQMGPASAACLSVNDALSQLEERRKKITETAKVHSELARFLADELEPVVAATCVRVETACARAGIAGDAMLDESALALSPSDYGFHNALRRPDGSLAFVDFEYFGWDDPAKMVSDFLLHPGMSIGAALKDRFFDAAVELLGGEVGRRRFDILYPVFALCWCVILLNAFLPDRFKDSDDESRRMRLRRARALLTTIARDHSELAETTMPTQRRQWHVWTRVQ